MANPTTQTPPPLSNSLVSGIYINRVWGQWVSSLYSKLGNANGLGKTFLTCYYSNLNDSNTRYVPVPNNVTLLAAQVVNNAPLGSFDETIIIGNQAGAVIGTLTIPAFSTAGTVNRVAFSTNNSFSIGDTVKIKSSAISGNTSDANFTLTFTY